MAGVGAIDKIHYISLKKINKKKNLDLFSFGFISEHNAKRPLNLRIFNLN